MATSPDDQPGIEIDQDLSWERREWVAERVAWALMFSIVLLALLGAFGRGVLSSATVSRSDSELRADYPRFGRYQSSFHLDLSAKRDAISEGRVTLWISREYLDAVVIDQITPEPDRVRMGNDRLYFEFEVDDFPEVPIHFTLISDRIGLQTAHIGLEHRDPLTFWQFVYP